MDTNQLKKLISEDYIDEVIIELQKQFGDKNNEINAQIINVSNRYKRLKSDKIKGIDEDPKENQKIVNALLEIINSIDKSSLTSNKIDESKGKTINNLYANNKKSLRIIGILAFFLLCFCIGYYNGLQTRKYSDSEFFERFIFSRISIDKEGKSNNVYLNYRCDEEIYYTYNIDNDEIIEKSFIDNSESKPISLIRIDTIMGVAAAASYFLNEDILTFVKKPFQIKGGIRMKLLMILGTVSTYSLGKWIGMRKNPKCLEEQIKIKLTDSKFWRRYEKYVFFYIHNKDVIGMPPSAINTISYCPIELLIDTMKLSNDIRQEIEFLYKNDTHLREIRQKIFQTNYNFTSEDFLSLFERNKKLKEIYYDDKYYPIYTQQTLSWRFARYHLYDYSIVYRKNYDAYFEMFIAKIN